MSDNKKPVMDQGLMPNQTLKQLFFFAITLLFLYTGIRILFFTWNLAHFNEFKASEIVFSFVYGIRFDLAIVMPIVFLTLLSLMIPIRLLRILAYLGVVLGHAFLLFGNFIDVELVNFMGRRFTRSSLYLATEGQNSNMLQYVFLSVITFVGLLFFLTVSYFFYHRLVNCITKNSFKIKSLLVLALIPVVIICGRGGFQLKPLSFVDAKIYPYTYSHHLVLNTSFTFLKSFGKSNFKKEQHYSENELLKHLNFAQKSEKNQSYDAHNFNLVLIVVESLSKEYLSQEKTPFLTELTKTGVYFDKSYANGRRSVEGLAAILSGVPSLMEESYLNSEFATNDNVGLGELFKSNNYHTSFFHGAANGTMRFDAFTKSIGFDNYFGKNEYPDKTQDDGYWGIYDDSFLQFACEKISGFKPPFASVVFTLSSHQPYKTPDSFDKKYQASPNEAPILKTINYVDESLKNFMACAKSQPWFNNTIFVITADHTGPALNESDSTFSKKFEIPIVFYASNSNYLMGLATDQYAQQIDLLPTFNDLFKLGYTKKNYLARSLYSDGLKTIALYSDQTYQLVGDGDLSKNTLNAIKQYYSEGLFDNRLYISNDKGN